MKRNKSYWYFLQCTNNNNKWQ